MNARVETSDMLLQADEIDYNTDTDDVELRGNVHYTNYVRGEKAGVRSSRSEPGRRHRAVL